MKINVNTRTWEAKFDTEVIDELTFKITCDQNTETFVIDDSLITRIDEYLGIVDTKLPYNPVQRISKINGEYIIDTFFDDVWTTLNPDPSLAHVSNIIELKPNLSMRKIAQKAKIVQSFNSELETGHMMSTAIGIEVDCRRSATKNDLQNVQGLISYMTRYSIPTIDYVGYTETKSGVTISDLEALCGEMEDHVLALYNKKWGYEVQIDNCATIAQVLGIIWV
jgi:hypothetical protein